MKFFRKIIAKVLPKKAPDPDAMYRFFKEESDEKVMKLMQEASRMATEEQRKIYYGDTKQSGVKP